jgi:hypothetical protein
MWMHLTSMTTSGDASQQSCIEAQAAFRLSPTHACAARFFGAT